MGIWMRVHQHLYVICECMSGKKCIHDRRVMMHSKGLRSVPAHRGANKQRKHMKLAGVTHRLVHSPILEFCLDSFSSCALLVQGGLFII